MGEIAGKRTLSRRTNRTLVLYCPQLLECKHDDIYNNKLVYRIYFVFIVGMIYALYKMGKKGERVINKFLNE